MQACDRYGKEQIPVIGGGDLNATASRDHLPQRAWPAANYLARSHKGKHVDDGTAEGTLGPDTDAVDHLIGR
ncbi:MAG: hypothetical protein QOE54_7319 [Streptosporangiaceae bacterium]|nr:Endonuclease/Exonuclease/phosphatase family [Streptosporangiaceae bacterium]MDX6434953.1 hypothetical protein [Streptosporangiaceae bacterium]